MSAGKQAGDGALLRIERPAKIEKVLIDVEVNGAAHRIGVRPYDVLLDVLRDQLDLTGTRRGCDMGTCGCCTVLMDGRPVLSCLTLAVEADGSSVTTIEGVAPLEPGSALHPVQEAFVQTGGSQCGFCTPGFIMTAVHLLGDNDDPTDDEIKEAISGNMCRCTGYAAIIEAIRIASGRLRERRAGGSGSGGDRP